jgi:nucleoside-triphosphatase
VDEHPLSTTVLLLTGVPGVGKTTVVQRVAQALAGGAVRGFLTREIREAGRRRGFRIEGFSGTTAVLAHEEIASRHRVGRYGVDLEALDRVVGDELALVAGTELYLVDEIGKMECFSPRFQRAVEGILDRGGPLLATIALRGGGFIAAVKRRPGVELWEVSRANRDALPGRILARFGRASEES